MVKNYYKLLFVVLLSISGIVFYNIADSDNGITIDEYNNIKNSFDNIFQYTSGSNNQQILNGLYNLKSKIQSDMINKSNELDSKQLSALNYLLDIINEKINFLSGNNSPKEIQVLPTSNESIPNIYSRPS